MVELISENQDKTTNEVVEWLLREKIGFRRRNVDRLTNCSIKLSSQKSEINIEKKISQTVWNRRGKLQLFPQVGS